MNTQKHRSIVTDVLGLVAALFPPVLSSSR
jgi:hypothetical protein